MHDSSSVVGTQMKTELSTIVYIMNSCLIFNWIQRNKMGAAPHNIEIYFTYFNEFNNIFLSITINFMKNRKELLIELLSVRNHNVPSK